ncbi:tripartite tricarboxylate transporter substrate binding protein [Polynucleobacter sp. AP-Melu-500A-A1]|uniref:Bug family tripartite tricarboxylate transporter substrate binding protein n=1 Tax=Polynucleobacter sp. AP-Melu-500A-A1 TaxID=2576929 RepID=UPI001C0DDD19|nr:tripartite tricarboxylate transporter substrate binding protein [Polynucleobacter sp. AP-Melu-500A-A1]MBU3631451.1 tripartite tricarboxylate transporter substrate binding protein [Polynucleobacter sp. AP-Melu-500A-A1]
MANFWELKLYKKISYIFLGLFLSFSSFGVVLADSFPSKPIRIIVPYPPGGGNDVLARMFAPELSKALGQSVIVENRPGAGGSMGSASVAKSAPDGYTLLIINTVPHTASAGIYPKLGYDPVKDFAGVALVASNPYVIAVNPNLPAKNITEFIALAKSQPGTIYYGSAGTGSVTHLNAELFKTAVKADLIHVPYKGGGPAIADLLGGQVQMTVENVFLMAPYFKAGQLRPIAVTGLKRSSILPDTPTIAESGYPNFEIIGQFGFVAPAGTPNDVLLKLNSAFNKITKSPEITAKLNAQGTDPRSVTPEAFQSILQSESIKWLGVIKEANIRGE